ncbi:unnamed protein product, partial [Brassica oleracea]
WWKEAENAALSVAVTVALSDVDSAVAVAEEAVLEEAADTMEAIPDKKWTPVTKLGRLVQSVHHRSAYQSFNLYLHSLPVKEYQIIDLLVSTSLKDEVMKIMHVQKQTRAGQRRRFKAFVVVRDGNGHVGLGVKCSKEVATAIRGGILWFL